jgi:hypothetical protein
LKLALLAAAAVLALCGSAAPVPAPKPRVLILGVAHLVAKADLHNATWGQDALAPAMQRQIAGVVARLEAFHPTKVMIEALPGDPKYVARYKAYLAGTYTLGPNEDDQFGYRLAAAEHLPTIYPVDVKAGFPFDYPAVTASAQRHGQTAILDDAARHVRPLVDRMNALEKQSRLLDLLRYINTPQALATNASWYTYVARIGDARGDTAGADLVSFWYARNLHIFANMMHDVAPGDRVVLIIGQGHAAMLRPLVKLSPFLVDVDPERYLRRSLP